MRFTLAQLEAFYWIAKLGTVRDAARHLNLAQPTVSLRLRDLETALGTMLFERLGRALRLTHEGLVLLQDATPLLAAAGQIQERSGTHDAVRGTIRLGVPETFAVVCLPKLIDLLSRRASGAPAGARHRHQWDADPTRGGPAHRSRVRGQPRGESAPQAAPARSARVRLDRPCAARGTAAGPTGRPAPPADHQQPASVATVPRDRRLVPKRRAGAAPAQLLQQRERDRPPGGDRRRDQRPASAHGRSTRLRPAG